jgi:hypothetical protein
MAGVFFSIFRQVSFFIGRPEHAQLLAHYPSLLTRSRRKSMLFGYAKNRCFTHPLHSSVANRNRTG